VSTRPRISLCTTRLGDIKVWQCTDGRFGGFSGTPLSAYNAWVRSRDQWAPVLTTDDDEELAHSECVVLHGGPRNGIETTVTDSPRYINVPVLRRHGFGCCVYRRTETFDDAGFRIYLFHEELAP
jgi:hypothetical protein